LRASAEAAGFTKVQVTEIEAYETFPSFDNCWQVQTLPVSPTGRAAVALDEIDRARLRETVQSALTIAGDGSITYPAHAVAMKARA
jgi:hypothetical protein